MEVAVIFDSILRPDTTGTYCLRALRQLGVEVDHYHPCQAGEIPSGYDLYLDIDDGQPRSLPSGCRPRAYWLIDGHWEWGWRLENARRAEWVFVAQRDLAGRLRRAGVTGVTWLPLACDPDIHAPVAGVRRTYDLAFVGHFHHSRARAAWLGQLQRRYPNSFVGQAFGKDVGRVYSAARLVTNRSLAGDCNMRVFEALACGRPLLTDPATAGGLDSLCQAGRHLITYRDEAEFYGQVDYYLRHENEAEALAAAGRAWVLEHHTYRHRMETLLACVGGSAPARPACRVISNITLLPSLPDPRAGGGGRVLLVGDALIELARSLVAERGCAVDVVSPGAPGSLFGGCAHVWPTVPASEEGAGPYDLVVLADLSPLGVPPEAGLARLRGLLAAGGEILLPDSAPTDVPPGAHVRGAPRTVAELFSRAGFRYEVARRARTLVRLRQRLGRGAPRRGPARARAAGALEP